MLIRDVLRKKGRAIITIRPTSSVAQAVSLLDEHNIGSLPVVDDRGRLCGIFSERDVLRGIRRLGEDFCRERIAAVMTRDVFTCLPDDSIHEAIGRMSTVGVGQLPVVEDGEVRGIVSAGDLLRVLHAEAEEENRHLHAYVQGVH
jgi:CBS domain-containing protein